MGIFDIFKRKREMQQLSRAEARERANERTKEQAERQKIIAREELLMRERNAVRGKKERLLRR